jgi:hypothetical protein
MIVKDVWAEVEREGQFSFYKERKVAKSDSGVCVCLCVLTYVFDSEERAGGERQGMD